MEVPERHPNYLEERRLRSVEEVALLLDVSEAGVIQLAETRQLGCVHIGRERSFRTADIARFLGHDPCQSQSARWADQGSHTPKNLIGKSMTSVWTVPIPGIGKTPAGYRLRWRERLDDGTVRTPQKTYRGITKSEAQQLAAAKSLVLGSGEDRYDEAPCATGPICGGRNTILSSHRERGRATGTHSSGARDHWRIVRSPRSRRAT